MTGGVVDVIVWTRTGKGVDMCRCKTYARLLAAQTAEVARLTKELDSCLDSGDEYHADLLAQEIIVADSPARLLHKHTRNRKNLSVQ